MMTLRSRSSSRLVTLPCLVATLLCWNARSVNAQAPYVVVFDFADPSIPKNTCATELNSIVTNLYTTYVDNVVADTWWTSTTVSTFSNDTTIRRRRDEEKFTANNNLDQQQQQPNHRRLPLCTARICRDVPAVIIAAGCRVYCGIRRHRNLRVSQQQNSDHRNALASSTSTTTSYSSSSSSTSGTFSSSSSSVTSYFSSSSTTSSSFSYTFNQSNPAQGWQGNYAPYRGYTVATAFYNAVNTISSKSCRALLSTMTYVLIDYD